MDSIFLKDIEVWTRIGVPDAERAKPQRVLVSLEIFSSIKAVSREDDVSRGIDYATVVDDIISLGKMERKTIERFAEDIAAVIIEKYKPDGGIRVSVLKKTDLPLESASITIIRP